MVQAIALGQGLSLHRELLPDEYALELQRLQDHVESRGGSCAVSYGFFLQPASGARTNW